MEREIRKYVIKAPDEAIFWNGYNFSREHRCSVYFDLEQVLLELSKHVSKFKKGDSIVRNYGEADEKTVYVIP